MPTIPKTDMVTHACHLSLQEAEAGGPGVQSYPQLHSKKNTVPIQ